MLYFIIKSNIIASSSTDLYTNIILYYFLKKMTDTCNSTKIM